MRKLNIAFVASGRNQFIRPYLNFFQQQGHQVSLISYDSFDTARSSAYPIHDVSSGANARRKGTKWRYIIAGLKTRRLLKRLKPDILHGHYVTSSGVICLLSGFRPYIVSARGSDLIGSMKSVIWRRILKQVFRRSCLVHTVSDQLSAKAATLGVKRDKLLTLTQGVDTGMFTFKPPSERLQTPIRMICTRTLGEVYDPATIVRACKVLHQAGIPLELTFAAGGDLEETVKELARQTGLEPCIVFKGGYANQDLPDILKVHDVYLSASRWDGTSVSLLEAMSVGLFPIVSRTESNLAWLEDGRTAVMFDCGDHDQLAKAIIRVIRDEKLQRSAVETNRRLVEVRADRTKNMRCLESRYYEILGLINSAQSRECSLVTQ